MAAPEKVQLWKELVGYSRKMRGSCVRMFGEEQTVGPLELRHIQDSIRDFRESFALLHLLRRESKLMEGLIDHDFLNRFAAVNFHLEACFRRPSPEKMERICELTWIFSEVVESLIFWVNHHDVVLEKLFLDRYIMEVRRNLIRSFSDVELSCQCLDQDVSVLIHSGTMTNLIINMMVNSMKHGGAKKIELISQKESEMAVLMVRDDGIGMDMPFPEIVPGLGLQKLQDRLDIMRATYEVEEHGGIEGGTLFRFKFPIAKDGPTEVHVSIPPLAEGEK